MGKKDKKSKNKISGAEKTTLKTEKKLDAKQKKKLAAIGEDDIEKVVAEIEKEEARRQCVKEIVVEPPSRRVYFTLTAHPFKDELIMLGGQFHDGRQTLVYGDMFFYNINKQEWTLIKAPCAPPPRCSHQTVATAANNGELWVFGGEFTSPSESQFYHYRDLWVFRFSNKKWEKIMAPNGPSARSGHRMVHTKKQLLVFGGFHDDQRHDYKYFNDVHIFDLETYTWQKIESAGIPPAPRSGCILLPTIDNKLVVYGGYSKIKLKKDVEKGCVHDDMFLLTQVNKNDAIKYKWTSVKQSGVRVSPRCGASATLTQHGANQAFVFGGVYDDDDDEETLRGTFYNDLFALDLEKLHWRAVTLSEKKETTDGTEGTKRRRRRKKQKDETRTSDDEEEEEEGEEENEGSDEKEESEESPSAQSVVVEDDGIFTVTIGPASSRIGSSLPEISSMAITEEKKFRPLPRINAGMAVKHNVLYLYGGMVEEGEREYTLRDFYSLDCRKLDKWNILMADDLSQTWFESSDDSEDSEEDESEESNSQEESENKMDVK